MNDPLPDTVDRRQAAALLRAARADVSHQRSETIDWAYVAMPDRRHVRRLKVEDALAVGDLDTAETILAQSLLVAPTDPTFARLRATSLLARGETGRAAREIDLALARRPHHVATRVLAAEIAQRRGQRAVAVRHLEIAVAARPWAGVVRRRLIEAYLALPDLVAARRLLAGADDDPALEARLLMAEGCPREAIERLAATPRTEDAVAVLLELLEAVGSHAERQDLLESIETGTGRLRALAADGWLRLGCFDRAVVAAFDARDDREAVAAGMIAAALLRRDRLALRFLDRLRRLPGHLDPARLAERWGRALGTQYETRPMPPSRLRPGVLADLLHDAAVVLDDGSRSGRNHRLTTVDVLGRLEAPAACVA